MSDPDNVAQRMTDIFEPSSAVAAPIDPKLPQEVADRIRDLIRGGDLEGAAELGRMALESLGVEPSELGS